MGGCEMSEDVIAQSLGKLEGRMDVMQSDLSEVKLEQARQKTAFQIIGAAGGLISSAVLTLLVILLTK